MPQYWLKPFGVTTPPAPMPDYWTDEVELDPFELMTVPAKIQNPPQMGRGDRVIFHAVIRVRLFGFGEILGNPKFTRDTKWAQRWPWIYPCRVAAGSRGSRTALTRVLLPPNTQWVAFNAAGSTSG